MPSNYTTRLRLEKQADGENANTWGDRLNQQVIDMVDEAVGGVVVVSTTGATTSLTASNGAADQSRNAVLRIEGTLGSNSTIVIPSVEKLYVVDNQTTGGTYTVKLKTAATTTNVIAPRGGSKFIYCDGVNVHNSVDPVGVSALSTEGGAVGPITVGGTASATAVAATRMTATSISSSVTDTTKLFATTAISVSAVDSLGKQLRITKSAVADIVSLTDASTISVNFNSGQNFDVRLGGNRNLGAPTNVQSGQTGSFFVRQDGTGSRTLSFNSAYKFVGGTAPTLTTTASAVDRIDYVVLSSSSVHMAASLDVK